MEELTTAEGWLQVEQGWILREHEGHTAVQPIPESSVTSRTFDKVLRTSSS